ncbi:MAG TPA: 4'-phosphopantetheinyl transferase superfamily protein [Mobilitalea sp.]|nr:4'-phosphopantetheinyl transferase superfamily protein [Mobilitalea sp.]
MVNIYIANIRECIDPSQINKFLNIISREKKERIERFHVHEDFLRSLYGDIIIRKTIEKELGIAAKNILIGINQYGKPYTINVPYFHFNISHSGDWVTCATSTFECGIDIEKITTCDINIAKSFFTKSEYIELVKRKGAAQTDYFFDLWTLKESYIKWKGKGLYMPLNSFTIKERNGKFYVNSFENDEIKFHQHNFTEKYKLALCTQEQTAMYHSIRMMDL